MGISFSIFAVLVLILIAILGANAGLYSLLGIVIPYLAFAIFLFGVIRRVLNWGRSPVPYRIPTTCGQQKSLPWIKENKLENPSSTMAVIGRMVLEIFFFRSLLRNTKYKKGEDDKFSYGWEKWLWFAGLFFHWSFFIIVIRHLRFFTEPVPAFVTLVNNLDGFFSFGLQGIYLTDILFLVAVTYLFIRRVAMKQVKYFSLAADYFPLLLILSIGVSGVLMKYFYRVDIVAVKELIMGLVTLKPVVPKIGSIFYVHIFLVSTLLAYFPFSKLMHMGGIFMSPTRNLQANSRAFRHINPWNEPADYRTYAEYEDEFRKVMLAAGVPVEKKEVKKEAPDNVS